MAIIDQVVVHRLIVQRLIAALGDGSLTGIVFKLASDPDPELDADPPGVSDIVKWCRLSELFLDRFPRQRCVVAGISENVAGADTARLSLTVSVFARVSANEDSEWAMASALTHVAHALDGLDLNDPAEPTAPVHTVSLQTASTRQLGEDESGLYVLGTVTFAGDVTRASGDTIEVRPALV